MKSPLLLWSSTGELACGEHAPAPGSETWASRRWHAMTEADVEAFESEHRHAPVCAMCAAIERRKGGRASNDIWHAIRTEGGWDIQDGNRVVVAVVPDAHRVKS